MKSLYLFFAIGLGSIVYQAESLSFLIRYSLMGMMFLSFLNLEINRNLFQLFHLKILISNILLGIGSWGICHMFFPSLATSAFLLGIMPTAIAATVIIGFLGGNTSKVVSSVLVTNIGIAMVLPWILPLISSQEFNFRPSDILGPVLITVLFPLTLALFITYLLPSLQKKLLPFQYVSFYLFVSNVFLASAKGSHFIRFQLEGERYILFYLVLLTLLMCSLNFLVGHMLGSPKNPLSGQQSLGRKNTMFGVWVALTFFSPLDALGPICYIFFQNVWNSYQIHKLS